MRPVTKSLMESVANTTAHRDRDSLNGAVAQLLLDYLDAEWVEFYRLVEYEGTTRLKRLAIAAVGKAYSVLEQPEDPSSLVALRDAPVWGDCVTSRRALQYKDSAGSALAVFPIEAAKDVVGLVVLRIADELPNRDIQFVSAVLRILRNHVELLDYSERDTLTHMLNRKTFESRFTKMRKRLRVSDSPEETTESGWLGMVDIDKFKSINDSHGHLFGDEVLLLVSQLMHRCFRGADQLFRFGGEEFVVALEHASVAGAKAAFDRLRATVETFEFPQVGRVTISLGYSQIRPDDGPTTCVERADAALYYAKQHGRNRICHFEQLVELGEIVAKTGGTDAELF